MEFRQFGKRYSSNYDVLGNELLVYQKRERISVLFVASLVFGVCVLAYPYLGNA